MAASLTYQQMLHDVAIRLNALVGTNKTTIAATYDVATLNATHFKSADWPFNSFRDAQIMAVADFSWAIADTGGHPWRSTVGPSVTPGLASGVAPPAEAANSVPIIGVWGAVRDSADNLPLTEQPLDLIRRINQEPWRTYPVYYFKFDGDSIYHTRPFVEIECCTYSQDAQLTIWNSGTGAIPLPEVLRPALAARAISILTKDGAFADQAAVYREYSNDALTRIRAGLTTLPSKTLPSPTMSAK